LLAAIEPGLNSRKAVTQVSNSSRFHCDANIVSQPSFVNSNCVRSAPVPGAASQVVRKKDASANSRIMRIIQPDRSTARVAVFRSGSIRGFSSPSALFKLISVFSFSVFSFFRVASPRAKDRTHQTNLFSARHAYLALYWPVLHFDFISYDDPEYVYKNPVVSAGLTKTGVLWALTSSYASNWHPLTWISHMMDCQVFGLNAGGHHLVSLLFHVANTCCSFWCSKG